ncbi:MAG TPA: ABC transporter substrate-binding protein [Chloroflexota bacterium]|nr:ABC transporter substrate-binding protein [Chloroflexota bacterium]
MTERAWGLRRRLGRRAVLRAAAWLGVGTLLGGAGCRAAPAASPLSPGGTPGAPSPTASGGASTPRALQKVRVAGAGSIAEAGIFIAQAKGYFQQEGIELEQHQFDSIVRAIPALGTNQVDVGAGAIGASLFNAIERGVDVRIVGPQSQALVEGDRGSLWYVVRRDLWEAGRVRDWSDLKGLTIAIPSKGGSNEYQLDGALRAGGLTSADANVVEIPFADQVTALENRSVDIAQLTEPFATAAVDRGLGAKWRLASAWTPRFQLTYLLYGPQLRTERADVARRWMVAYLKGARWYMQALAAGGALRDELFQILAAHTTVKDPALLARMSFTTLAVNGEIFTEDILAQARWAQERGYITTIPTLDQLVDDRFVQAAVAELGRE